MLTSFSQVAEWIKDNGFKRWVLYFDYSHTQKMVDSASFQSELPDKIAMTEKYLRLNGGHAYAAGGPTAAASDLNTFIEISLNDAPGAQQPTAGVGMTQDIGAIEERLRKQIKAEIAQERYEQERKEFEAEKKEFEAEKQSVIGLIVGQIAPYIPVLNSAMNKRMVAGIDTQEPVHAQPIVADDPKDDPENPEDVQEASAWDNFTEEEGEEIGKLMAEFKSVEPQYLDLLRSVVKMAKSGDVMYKTAKGFLLKA